MATTARIAGDFDGPAPASTPAERQGGGYAWYVVGVLALTYLVSVCDRFIMSVAVVPLRTSLGLSDTQLGLVSGTGFALLYCVVSVPTGLLIDRTHRVGMMIGGLAVWTLSTAACAFADSFAALFAARIFVGLGEAVAVPASMSLIAATVRRDQLGRATSVFLIGGTLGKVVAYIGGGAVLTLLTARGGLELWRSFEPWQGMFLAAGLLGVLPLALLLLTVREPARVASTARAGVGETWRHMRRHAGPYRLHFAYGTMMWIVGNIYSTWAPSFYVRQYGLDVGTAAFLSGIASLCVAAAGSWIGGYAMDRLRSRGHAGAPQTVIAIAMGASALFCVCFTNAPSLWLSIVCYALAQLTALAGAPAALAGIQMLTPAPQRGLAVAIFVAVQTLGSLAIGPAIIGLINDHLFDGRNLGAAMWMLAAGAALIGVPLALRARRPFEATAAHVEEAC